MNITKTHKRYTYETETADELIISCAEIHHRVKPDAYNDFSATYRQFILGAYAGGKKLAFDQPIRLNDNGVWHARSADGYVFPITDDDHIRIEFVDLGAMLKRLTECLQMRDKNR